MRIQELNGATLAFIGDAYYELRVREHVLRKGITNLQKLHNESVKFVSRSAQSRILHGLYPILTEEECTIYKRGRNYKYKDHDEEYLTASGFEAIIGYLYLRQEQARLDELFGLIVALIGENNHE
ncbi:MAG: ribonuclease III domain-containing protein [Bacilli bacterium]|nr:ribonuclease III domain-containing protein [Bacilli bacterium]